MEKVWTAATAAILPSGRSSRVRTESTEEVHTNIRTVVREGHAALASPRQLARFLCGLTSPAATRQRLSRHNAFGLLSESPFADVLALAEAVV